MLRVVQSNQLEVLATHLADTLQQASPLQPETVIVSNQGVARWLWLQLARQHGISANLDFVLPGSFVWRLFHQLLPDVPETSAYDPALLTWRLHRLLAQAGGEAAFAPIEAWCVTDDERLRFEFAGRLAHQFDQYLIYRPDWIAEWQAGGGSGWQPELWRRLAADTDQPDWMSLRHRLAVLEQQQVAAVLSQRVCMFGIQLLSPAYLDVMNWLGGHIDLHMYLPNPCQEHWAHIVPERDFSRLAGVADEKLQYIESGNALLASWGGQGRDVPDMLEELNDIIHTREFVEPGTATLLHAVQSHILNLEDPGANGAEPVPAAEDDCSIQIHICHSPTRELEVLHDRLLDMFAADPALSASDVVVMMPDINSYAPLIDAVFATANQIPFHLADLKRRSAPLIDAYLGLFDLVQDRFDANAVLALLEVPAVRQCFGLAESEMQRVGEWIRAVGIRWGLDRAMRAGHGRSDGRHSWRHGLDRLLLGFVMPGEETGPFRGVLPFDGISGSDGETLGGVVEFIDRLRRMTAQLAEQRTACEWSVWLQQQLTNFFVVAETQESEAQSLRNAIDNLGQHANLADHAGLMPLEAALDWIVAELDSSASTRGYLGHGVTFAGIVPMRNVPFRVVCLIGMNDSDFPRIERPPGFDLIARHPRRGDRSRRDDDRQAFLECLQNARDIFYLSFVGRGARDDATIPPSVLISELIDYCNRAFKRADGKPAGSALTTVHRVQPFSKRYYDGSDPALFTYSDTVAGNERCEQQEFFAAPLTSGEEQIAADLDNLVRFFHNPTKILLLQRLNLSYEGDTDPVATADPVELDGLTRWNIGDKILRLAAIDASPDEIREILQEQAATPSGKIGQLALGDMIMQGQQLFAELQRFLPPGQAGQIDFAREFPPVTLSGRLQNVYPSGLFGWRYGRTRGRDYLSLWLHHLVLNIVAPDGIDKRSHWRANDGSFRMRPVAEPKQHLDQLLRLYRRGLQEPLPFFPESAWTYIEVAEKKDSDKALAAARKKYYGDYRSHSESLDPYRDRVFENIDWQAFADLAMAVYGPLRHHLDTTA